MNLSKAVAKNFSFLKLRRKGKSDRATTSPTSLFSFQWWPLCICNFFFFLPTQKFFARALCLLVSLVSLVKKGHFLLATSVGLQPYQLWYFVEWLRLLSFPYPTPLTKVPSSTPLHRPQAVVEFTPFFLQDLVIYWAKESSGKGTCHLLA